MYPLSFIDIKDSDTMSLRPYLNQLKKSKQLIEVEIEVDLDEATTILKENDGKAVFFKKISQSKFPLIGNLISTREQLKFVFPTKKKIHLEFYKSALKASYPKITETNETFINELNTNLLDLPIPQFFKTDGGRYLTSGILFANYPENIPNLSIHRIMLIGKDKGVIRLVHRDLFSIFSANKNIGKDTPVAIVIGYHPALALAASYPLAKGESELSVANSLMGGKLLISKTPKYGIDVPSNTEFVLEGKILANETYEEGPFVDITGTADIVRKQPIIKIEKVYHRNSAIFQTILPAHNEHFILMGFPREAKIVSEVSKVVQKVHDVYLTPEGCGWLSANISVTSKDKKEIENVAMAAFKVHPSLKWCTIVNSDIDVTNASDVEWARITRAGEGDIKILHKMKGSSLDPSRNLKDNTSIKIIINATKKLDRDQKGYDKVIGSK